MKVNSLFFAVSFLLIVYGCTSDRSHDGQNDTQQTNTEQESPVKLIEILVGEWESQGGGDGQAGDRIRFTEEARYIAYSGNQKVDSGAYRMNEQLKNLYLESESNERPREFEINVEGDMLTLTPRENQNQPQDQRGSFTYRRVGSSSAPTGSDQPR